MKIYTTKAADYAFDYICIHSPFPEMDPNKFRGILTVYETNHGTDAIVDLAGFIVYVEKATAMLIPEMYKQHNAGSLKFVVGHDLENCEDLPMHPRSFGYGVHFATHLQEVTTDNVHI